MPGFERAKAALETLKASDFQEIKGYTNPTDGVKLPFECICIMLEKPVKFKKENGKVTKELDYWTVSKKLINDWKKLIADLKNYDVQNVKPEVVQKVLPYLINEEDTL